MSNQRIPMQTFDDECRLIVEKMDNQLNSKEVIKIATIKELAQNYTAPTIKNIAELEKVSTSINAEEKTFKKEDGTEFKLNVINVDGEEHRVPNSVLNNLKLLLEESPNLEFFKVKKEGQGLKTHYTVIPLG